MIVGIGLDLMDIDRWRQAVARRGERLLARVFTPRERADCARRADPSPSYAARFAAKESLFKALGTGWSEGVSWTDAEVRTGPSGEPRLHVTGAAGERLAAMSATRVHLSLTHSPTTAAAVVILESDPAS